MAKPSHPSNLELQALSVLWHAGPSTVSAVHEALPDGKDRAYTTVLSVMQGLERKRLVRRSLRGRAHVYEAAHSQEAIAGRAARDFLINAFGGRLGEALLAMLSAGTLTPDEKTKLERELQRHKTMAAKKTTKKVAKKAPAKKAAKKAVKKAPAKKAAKAPAKKAAKAPAKKAAKKVAKKAVKKVAKSAKKAAKKAVKKVVAKKAAKAPAKKAAKKAPAKKAAKAPAKKVAKKAPAKKAAKAPAKKAAKKAAKK